MTKKKKTQKAAKEPKKDEYLDQLQRLQAEFINYRNRIEKEHINLIKFAKEDLILKLLNILDNFERALSSMETTKDLKSCKQGINLILNQFKATLESEGLQAIPTEGIKFNPYEHEAVALIDSDKEQNTILEEFQRGYKLKDKVIRPSKVKVSGGKKNE